MKHTHTVLQCASYIVCIIAAAKGQQWAGAGAAAKPWIPNESFFLNIPNILADWADWLYKL